MTGTLALAHAKKQASTHAGRAVAARILGLPISAVLAFATSRIIIHEYGIALYGLFALILAIPALLPSKDLGLGASVIDVVARRASLGLEEVEATLAAAIARVLRMALLGIVGVFVIQFSVGWRELLGSSSRGFPTLAISAAIVLFILSLPGALSGSVLWGLRRNDVLALQAPLFTLGSFLSVACVSATGLPLWVAVISTMAASCVIQWSTLYFVAGRIGLSRRALMAKGGRRSVASLRGAAVPMMVISTASAAGYQTDRIVLSHVAGALEVARYSVVAQLYLPLWALISSAGYTLWGKYAVEREKATVASGRFWLTEARFAAVGVLGGATLTALGPAVLRTLLGIHVSLWLCAAFGLFLAAQSAGLPVGMYLTDLRGLRYQSALFVGMLALNLELSLVWARSLGAAGPVLASAASYGAIVLLPTLYLISRSLAKGSPDTRAAPSLR